MKKPIRVLHVLGGVGLAVRKAGLWISTGR